MAIGSANIPGVSVDLESLLEIQQRLSGLSLQPFKRLATPRSGTRQTRFLGRGMEYEESRAYVVGDDIKAMDWRVMARTGKAHTKVFSEQKDRLFKIAVDLSPSMFFGTHHGFKSWAAAEIAAHVGWLVSMADDRLGGLVVSTNRHFNIRSRKSRGGLLPLFHRICEACDHELPVTAGPSRLNLMLGELQRSSRHGSVVVLISDFIAIDDTTAILLQRISRHQEIIACWVHDKTEVEPWPPGAYPLQIEQQTVVLDTGSSAPAAWLSRYQQSHRDRVESLVSQFNIALIPVSCNRDITSQLMPYLRY